mmetsp:Transcript_4138/g.18391  ORF Transcript_4138/g.18391 Transcript_4138/m.18391 type:complete len:343 (+) Transcript_4138:406-1434(+)
MAAHTLCRAACDVRPAVIAALALAGGDLTSSAGNPERMANSRCSSAVPASGRTSAVLPIDSSSLDICETATGEENSTASIRVSIPSSAGATAAAAAGECARRPSFPCSAAPSPSGSGASSALSTPTRRCFRPCVSRSSPRCSPRSRRRARHSRTCSCSVPFKDEGLQSRTREARVVSPWIRPMILRRVSPWRSTRSSRPGSRRTPPPPRPSGSSAAGTDVSSSKSPGERDPRERWRTPPGFAPSDPPSAPTSPSAPTPTGGGPSTTPSRSGFSARNWTWSTSRSRLWTPRITSPRFTAPRGYPWRSTRPWTSARFARKRPAPPSNERWRSTSSPRSGWWRWC